jgi:succinate-acetate transporter protein
VAEPQGPAAARVFLRPIANPMGLGFLGLAGATMTVSALELGWIAASERGRVGLIMLIVAPIPQLIASVFGFLARDDIAASGFGWLTVIWLAYGIIEATTPPGSTSGALGVFLVVGAAGLMLNALGSGPRKGLPFYVLIVAALRVLLTAAFELSDAAGVKDAAAWVGVVLTPLALYASIALSLEDLRRRPVLPTLRRGSVRSMFDEELPEQVSEVAQEAGVRRQL